MSGLRSVIGEITANDLGALCGDELAVEAVEASRAVDVLTWIAMIADEVRRRGIHEAQGFLSVTRWLAHHTDSDDATAQRHVSMGRTLREHSETRRRGETGDLSGARLRILTRAARAHPDAYREHEGMLVGFADQLSLKDLRRAVTHWGNCADAVAERTFAEQQEAAYLFVSLTADDMVKIDGLLDKETGEAVLTALDAAMTPTARTEGATGALPPAPRRRAEALGEICTGSSTTTRASSVASGPTSASSSTSTPSSAVTARDASWSGPAPSPPTPPGASSATPRSPASSSPVTPNRWRWGGRSAPPPRHNAGRSPFATEDAPGPDAADPPPGATPTTTRTGSTEAQPTSTSSSCSAGDTTSPSTPVGDDPAPPTTTRP